MFFLLDGRIFVYEPLHVPFLGKLKIPLYCLGPLIENKGPVEISNPHSLRDTS